MIDETDQMLIRAYARCRCEKSFTELVRRHVDLVHSTALRIVRGVAMAEEVTQRVFLALAQHSVRLQGRSSLTGWLHETTRNLSINTVRSEERRRQREGEAATMNDLIADESQETWHRLAMHLDEAISKLKRGERDVILWRYFEHKTAEQIGMRLGLGPDAAQKRVARAMDHLRAIFAKRGITISAASLAAILSVEAVKAAPAGLAVAVNALASLTTTSTIQLIMASTQAKIGIAALVVAASITTPVVLQHFANLHLKEEVAFLRQQTAETEKLREEGEQLRAEARSSESQRAKEQTELARLRGELAALKARETKAEVVSKASAKAEAKTAEAAPASTGKLLLAQEMRNVGFADPASSYQTLQWAKMKGDTNVISNALAWGDEHSRAEVEAVFAAAPEAVRAKYASADQYMLSLFDHSGPQDDRHTLVSSRILEENVSGEEANLQVEYNWADGSTTTGPMRFVQIGNDWRQALNFEPPALGKMNTGLQKEGAALENQPVSK